jgi:hypothetical protein
MIRYAVIAAGLLAVDPWSVAAQLPPGNPLAAVRRLAPSAFPQLPQSIRRDLEARGCRAPQSYDESTPHNVMRGSFTAAGRSEWAVLCSVRDTATILIHDARRGTVLDSLERSSDAGWVQGIGGGQWGYSRYLSVLPGRAISRWRVDVGEQRLPQPIDHDAINQAFSGKGAEAFYRARGRWFRQVTSD